LRLALKGVGSPTRGPTGLTELRLPGKVFLCEGQVVKNLSVYLGLGYARLSPSRLGFHLENERDFPVLRHELIVRECPEKPCFGLDPSQVGLGYAFYTALDGSDDVIRVLDGFVEPIPVIVQHPIACPVHPIIDRNQVTDKASHPVRVMGQEVVGKVVGPLPEPFEGLVDSSNSRLELSEVLIVGRLRRLLRVNLIQIRLEYVASHQRNGKGYQAGRDRSKTSHGFGIVSREIHGIQSLTRGNPVGGSRLSWIVVLWTSPDH